MAANKKKSSDNQASDKLIGDKAATLRPEEAKADRSKKKSENPVKEKKRTFVEIVSLPGADDKQAIEANSILSGANSISREANKISAEANNISREVNKISKRYQTINVLLLVCTLVIAGTAIYSYTVSKTAAEIAKETLDAAKSYQKQALATQKIAENKKDSIEREKFKRDTQLFNLQKRSVAAQITSLKETQRQFELESRPFLQIENIKIDSNYGVSYNLVNSGIQPLQIISGGEKIGFFSNPNFHDFGNYNKGSHSIIHSIIANKSSIKITGEGKSTGIDSIKTGKKFIYIIGEYGYKNLADPTKKYYFKFDIKISEYPIESVSYLLNVMK